MNRFPFVLGVVLVAVSLASAQRPVPQDPRPPTPQFRTSVEVVHLDVSVLDRQRRPVRGLKPEDFTVFEDGKAQSIAVFQAVDIPDPEPPSAPWMRDVVSDVRSNADVQERRLFLLIMDDAAIQAGPRAINTAKDIARKVIDGLGPSDLAAVVFTLDNRNAQDFTADRARLLHAASRFNVGFRDMGLDVPGQDDGYFAFSANVVESAVDILSSMPDRRKAIIYVSQGIPVNLEETGFASPGLPAGGGISPVLATALASRVRTQLTRTFERARRANVNVYAIDPCGLRVPGEMGGSNKPLCAPGVEQEYLRTVADNTGGRAVVDTNEFDTGVKGILAENASYYLLGYQPRDQRFDGKVRRLEVKVNRPDVEVRTRSSYKAEKEKDVRQRQQASADSPLRVALSGVLPKSDLPLQMSAVPFAIPGKKESAVAVVVGVRQPLRRSDARVVEKVDLQVSAFGVEGKHIASRRLLATVTIRADASGLGEYEVLSRVDLRPGRYQLRIAANVGSLMTSGSLYYDVEVPDFSKDGVSLSGVVLSATPGGEVAPRDALTAVMPVIPTTRRTYVPADRVLAFVRVYQGGKDPLATVPLRVHVLDPKGAPVMDSRQVLAPAQFIKNRAADVLVPVPVDRLAAGEYLLVVESEKSKRDVRFRVSRNP